VLEKEINHDVLTATNSDPITTLSSEKGVKRSRKKLKNILIINVFLFTFFPKYGRIVVWPTTVKGKRKS